VNTEALRDFAEGFFTGFFGRIGESTGVDPTFSIGRAELIDAQPLEGAKAYNAMLGGAIRGGGHVAILLRAEDAYNLAINVGGAAIAVRDALDAEDLPKLTEALSPFAEAGAAHFATAYGRPVVFESIEMAPSSAETLAGIVAATPSALVDFSFDVPDKLHSKGGILITENLQNTVAADQIDEAPTLSKDEVHDILSDFGNAASDDEVARRASARGRRSEAASENLGRILDIQLTDTARLGRIEMPIAEILALGPGSIVEVGHIVDEPVELLVNNKLIARGDVVVVDEKFGLRITEIISPEERIESLT
jgi:flagellar motor switch protein FliN/FliY